MHDVEPHTPLTADEAEALVQARIEDFGLGALPRVRVHSQPDGTWLVQWEDHTARCAPMSMPQWKRWLERRVGPIAPERLATLEG